ncbi:hypothetical protein Tco_0124405, partial [Tanacetum coccineum]
LYGKIQSRSPGRGRSAEMHEDVQGDYVFLQGEVAAFSHSRKKHPRRGNSQKEETSQTSKRVLKTSKGRIGSHIGHSTDECMQLRKQIDEMIKSGKLSQFIEELKQNNKPKAPKKGETAKKDKPLAILMIQPWERVARMRTKRIDQ